MRPAPRAPRREPTPVQRPNGRVLVRPGALCLGRSPDGAGLVRSNPGPHRSAVPKRSADDLSAGCCQPRCYPLLKALLGILLGISGGAYDLAVTTSRILPLTWGNPRAREGNRTLDLRITSASLCRLSYSGLHPRSVADLLDRRLVVITPAGALELHRRIFKDHTSAGLAVTVRV